ncbi:hypothetical protein [Marinomonas algicola]|uniref:hypothetical protein n=1 Tax=Marinomonas algicola TaxID=2773454 RepID=UPI00174E5FE8|nr:hypothetical protein [Marinomonas algicola]
MEKWLFWGLIEASTVLFAVATYFSWRAWNIYKQPTTENKTDPTNTKVDETELEAPQENPASPAEVADAFMQYIDQHINVALDKLEAIRETPNKYLQTRNKLKLWGTILKAQKAMFMNNKQDDPLPILQRFLSSVLDAVTKESQNTVRIESLKTMLAEISRNIQSATKEVAQKISSLEQQKIIQSELRTTLSQKDKVMSNIQAKEDELKELNRFVKKSRQLIQDLKTSLANTNNQELISFSETFNATQQQTERNTDYDDYHSLKKLTALSKRQQIVIDQLKASLRSSKSKKHSEEDKESQALALKKMMKLTEESDSLIQQLENEISNENLTIEGMKNKLSQKEEKIKQLELKIKDSDSSVSESLKSNSQQKTATLNTYKTNMNNANHLTEEHVQQQASDVEQLERLLKESETCVALLTNELSSVEEENIKLLQQVGGISQQQANDNKEQNDEASFKRLNDEISMLEKEINKLNISLLESPAPNNYDTIKAQFKSKELELQRLEFAHSDLEKKYLKAVENKEAND